MDAIERFQLREGERVRAANPADLEAVVGLCLSSCEDHGEESVQTDRSQAAVSELRKIIEVYLSGEYRELVCLVYETGGAVAGYALVEISNPPWIIRPRTAEVNGMYIRPECRSLRGAMAILRSIRDWARNVDAERVHWHTHHIDKGIFERIGQAVYTTFRLEV